MQKRLVLVYGLGGSMKLRDMIVIVLQAQDDKEDYLICLDRIGRTVSFELEMFAERLCDLLSC